MVGDTDGRPVTLGEKVTRDDTKLGTSVVVLFWSVDDIVVGGKVSFPKLVGRRVGKIDGIDADGGNDLGIDALGDGKEVLVDNIEGGPVESQVGRCDCAGLFVRSGFCLDSSLPLPFGLLPGVLFIIAFLGRFAAFLRSDDLYVRAFVPPSRLFSQNKIPNALYRCSHPSAPGCNDFLSCLGILYRSFKSGRFLFRFRLCV